MFIISVIGQKGGDGKTTLTLGLAVSAALNGKTATIIDLDPQANAANWRDRRELDNPEVVCTQAGRLRKVLDALRETGTDLAFIDTPGRSDATTIEAAKAADLVLVPVRSQIFGMETLATVSNVIQVAGSPAAFIILNGIHPSSTRGAEIARLLVEQNFDLRVAPHHLCTRQRHADAPATGSSPQEEEPEGKAAEELTQLYNWTCKQLYGD